MFEMVSGYSPSGAVLTEKEYEGVKDAELKRILQVIFSKDTTVKKVANL